MALEDLLWIDWVGLALAAYGLAAGAVRGLTQQFSRWVVWLLAVLFAGAASPVGAWMAELFTEDPERLAALRAWLQLAFVLAAVLLFGGLRRFLLGHREGPRGFADRLLGLICGLGTAAVVWLVVFGTALHGFDDDALAGAASRDLAHQLTLGYERLPDALRSELLLM